MTNQEINNKSQWQTRIKRLAGRLKGGTVEYDLKNYCDLISQIDTFDFSNTLDKELQKQGRELSDRACAGCHLDDLMVQAFALVREVSYRLLGLRPFDVQLMAGIALFKGKLAQMQTGEGKTLAAVFPAYLNALTERGVHVLTANDYLAQRDASWMGPIYEFLDLTTGYVREGMDPGQRRDAYNAHITYLTAREAGFDYLRDQICFDSQDLVQRPFHYAIVDEADFIMIDEARVPLVIAGQAPDSGTDPLAMADLVCNLKPVEDYEIDENARNVSLTDRGFALAEETLNRGCLQDPGNLQVLSSLNVALHAHVLLHRDKDYIVRHGKIELVDEFTGRVADKRRWPHGIQPAVEAAEGVEIQPEGHIYGSITLQHFLCLYPRLAGMTATAEPAAEEFFGFYQLRVVVIPPNRPCVRVDHADMIFANREAKHKAMCSEIARVHAQGRPILVGTGSVAESETLAGDLEKEGVSCRVLNARNNETEAKIIARAGALGAVTISTNMAGRGTDIRLGGENEEQRLNVVSLGGLYVIGTNRHESRRVDNQLRGRSGRQGDPGSSRFFISLEDDLMERYGIRGLLPRKYFSNIDAAPIQDPMVTREIARCQRIIEGQNYEIRKTLHGYSEIVEFQRQAMAQERRDVLAGDYESLLQEEAAARYDSLVQSFGAQVLHRVERRISLYHRDSAWSDYLAYVVEVREGIHLLRLGGAVPLLEFQKTLNQAFDRMREEIGDKIVETFAGVTVTAQGIDVDKEGLRGPSSTWTYLINDNPFSNLGLSLIAGRNIGFAAGAGFLAAAYLPITLILVGIRNFIKWHNKKKGDH